MSYTKAELKAREAVRVALSKLHSAEVAEDRAIFDNRATLAHRKRTQDATEELKRAAGALVNSADRNREAGDTRHAAEGVRR